MNEEIKQLWIEELRSGRHEQTKGVLCTTDGKKCCLGVLTELARERGVVSLTDTFVKYNYQLKRDVECNVYGDDEAYGILPYEVREWADLPDVNPGVVVDGKRTLSELNDTYGRTFNEIADVIEEQL